MPTLNEPNYENVQKNVVRCLKAWKPDYTEADEAYALKKLDEIWPGVDWTNVNYIIRATEDAAKLAIAASVVPADIEEPPKKKRGRPPKNKVVTEEEEETDKQPEQAEVNEGVVIE